MRTIRLPPDSPASAKRRGELCSQWDDTAEFAKRLRCSGELVEELRRSGRLLGVWIAEQSQYRYPPFQLDASGVLIPEIAHVLEILRGQSGVAKGGATSGWEELEWLLAPNAQLARKSPAECLTTAAQHVLEVASEQFSEDPNASW